MMKYKLQKLMALTLALTLLCALLPMGAMATDTQASDVVTLMGVSRSEVHNKKGESTQVLALAFRFRIDTVGLAYGPKRATDTTNAKVTLNGATYSLVRFGAIMANKATIGEDPDVFVVENADDKNITNIEARYLFGVSRNYGEFVTRMVNIPVARQNTLIYARPYYVYKDADGNEVTAYGATVTANASGKKIRYAANPSDLNWTAGTLSVTDGTEQDSAVEIRTDYINSTDLLIRLPEISNGVPTAYVRAYYYSADGFLSSVEVKDNWTVLGDLGVPSGAVGVRLTAYAADGTDVTDVAALGASVPVTGNKRVGSVPLTFRSGALSQEDGTEIADASYTRTGYLPIRNVLVKPEGDATFMSFFYDADHQFISCGSFFMTRAKKVTDLAPASAAYVRFLVKEPTLEEGEEQLTDSTVVPFGMTRFFAYLSGSDQYRDFEGEANAVETEPTEPTEPSVPSDPTDPTDPTDPSDPSDPSDSTTDSTTGTTTGTTTTTKPEEPLILTADVPENQGVQNALWNMQQLVNITYTPIRTLPQTNKDFPANVSHKGLPYSSSRIEQAYVGSNVSFHTFMTALQNPNSYLYTVDLAADYNNKNGKTYYGVVCSTACAYALGIVPNYTTYQWTEIPGMSLLETQNVQQLKLGDTIVGQGHVVMITGIVRDQHGNVVSATVSEAAGADTHSRNYTVTALEERFPANLYQYCRYEYIKDTTYTASEYVAVGDETAQKVTYNTTIIPRKGDKANWRTTETVVLDVLKPSGYSSVKIYRWESDDWQLVKTVSVTDVVKLSGLEPGTYKAQLTGSKGNSKSCYWLVTDVVSKAELYQGTRQVKVSFTASSNAEPLYIQWINGSSNATIHITPLTDEHKAAGYGIFKPARGYLKARVAYRTAFGIIYAELPDGFTVE